MKTNHLSSPFICFEYEISCVHLAKNNNKKKASNLWNQKMCLWNPFADVTSKINYDTFKVNWERYRYSLPVCLEIFSRQSLRADEAILALLTLFQSGKQERKYSIQCYLPFLVAFTVISFVAVLLCRSHLRENRTDRKRLQRRLPSRLFSPFFLEWGLSRNAPLLSRKDAWHHKKHLKRRLNFRLHFSKMLQVVFWLV